MYYSLQVGTDRFIISSEPLTLGDKEFKKFTDYRTFIYTTGCLLAGDVEAQELHLHTASFTTSGTPTFNLAGKDGKNATSGDSSIADGTKGRDFYFSSANFEYKSRFKVNAKGGNGGRGYDNALSQKGGTGGKGGDGGNVKIMYEDTYQVAIDGYDSYDDAISAENPDEDTIKLVAKAWIEDLHVVVKDPKKVTEKIQYLYGELEKTDEYGHPKITISLTDLEAKIEDLKRALEDLKPGDGMAGDLEDGINCAGGARGTGGDGDPRGDPGQRGNDGSYDVYNDMDDDAIWDSEELLFHPDQISIIFRDAYAEYFRGAGENGSENIQTCATLLGQLLQRLAFLDDIDPNDSSSKANSNLWKAYKHREADILVLPSSDDKPTTIKTLQTVYKKAQTYMAQLTSGQDIFGHSPSWVPRGSFEFYQTQVNQVLKSFGDIETNYQAYKKRDWKQKSKLQWILDGISSANAAIENITLHQTTIAKLIPPLIEDIKTLNAQIPVKKTHLLNSIKEVEKQIKDHDGVSLKEFLDSAVSFAFQPGPAMGIIVGGKIWRDSSQGIEDDAGNLVDKSFLINQLEEIDGTVAGLKEGIALTNAGSLDPEDAGGAKLIAAREALMNLISSYKDVISEWKVIKNQFDDYINTVISRNNKALQYNQYIISWLQDEFSIQQQNDTIDKLQKKGLDTIDPEIPAVAAFVEQSYYSTVDQILKILYMAERALAFWAVELPLDNFDTVRRSGIDGGGLSASLSSLQTKILSEYSTAVEQSTSAYQKFGNWIGTGNGSGPNVPLVYQLSDDEWNPFTTGDERISVNMSNTYAEVTKDANIFLGRYDVRLVNVRFFLEGDLAFYDESGDMSVRASLRHNGFETIVDSNNGPNSFEHSILDFEFSYVHPFDSHNPQILTEGNMFDSPNPSKLSFALFGPFTVWDIYITKDWNPNLDMDSSQISGARLEFTGWSKTVSP